ncbi:MAG: hypothetical protein AAGL11_07100 [Pseudomonadota bacterium]
MFFGRNGNSDIYRRAYEEFMGEVGFYMSEVREYFIDLSMPERVFALCLFILFLVYLIVARARRKYNPGSLGRQFVGAVVLVGIVLLIGNVMFDHTPGAYSSLFQL